MKIGITQSFSGRIADAYGSLPGHDLQQVDAEQTYIQAELEGEETWVHLPLEAYTGTEHEHLVVRKDASLIHARPCVRLKKALYGHPDAGSRWERHCDARVASCGFHKVPEWPSCYFNSELYLFPMIYADDFELSGPAENLWKGWR